VREPVVLVVRGVTTRCPLGRASVAASTQPRTPLTVDCGGRAERCGRGDRGLRWCCVRTL